MSHTSYIIVFTALTIMGCNAQTPSIIEGDKWNTHVDEERGFTVEFPSTWKTSDNDSTLDPRVAFYAQEDSNDSLDLFNENFNITAFEAHKIPLDSIVAQNYEAGIEAYGDKIRMLSEPLKNASGIDSRTIVLEVSAKGLELISYSTFMTNGNHVFDLGFMMEKKNIQYGEPIMRRVVSTFKWK